MPISSRYSTLVLVGLFPLLPVSACLLLGYGGYLQAVLLTQPIVYLWWGERLARQTEKSYMRTYIRLSLLLQAVVPPFIAWLIMPVVVKRHEVWIPFYYSVQQIFYNWLTVRFESRGRNKDGETN